MVVAVEVQEGGERRPVVGWGGLGRKDKEELLSTLKLGPMRPSDDECCQATPFPAGHFLLRPPGLTLLLL